MFKKLSALIISGIAFFSYTSIALAASYTVSNVSYDTSTHQLDFDMSSVNPPISSGNILTDDGVIFYDTSQSNGNGGTRNLTNYNCNNYTHCSVTIDPSFGTPPLPSTIDGDTMFV